MTMAYSRTYSELVSIRSFTDRFEYVKLSGIVGQDTFGAYRYLNQQFYRSKEWKKIRQLAMLRDGLDCCDAVYDLAHPDRPIFGRIIVHHLNPITPQDVIDRSPVLFDLENLVCVSELTHKALSYSDESIIPKDYTPRFQNDTCPWLI